MGCYAIYSNWFLVLVSPELNPEVLEEFKIGQVVDLKSVDAFKNQLEKFVDDLIVNTDTYQKNLDAANQKFSQSALIQNILR